MTPEVPREYRVRTFAERVIDYFRFDGETRETEIQALVDATLKKPDSYDWKALGQRAHEHQMEKLYGGGGLYREWKRILKEDARNRDT